MAQWWNHRRVHCAMWPEDEAEAIRLRKEGWTYAEISEKLGFAESTISDHCRAVLGTTPSHRTMRLDEAEAWLAKGKTLKWVVDYLGFASAYNLRRSLNQRRQKIGKPPHKPVPQESKVTRAMELLAEGKTEEEAQDILQYKSLAGMKATIRNHVRRRGYGSR